MECHTICMEQFNWPGPHEIPSGIPGISTSAVHADKDPCFGGSQLLLTWIPDYHNRGDMLANARKPPSTNKWHGRIFIYKSASFLVAHPIHTAGCERRPFAGPPNGIAGRTDSALTYKSSRPFPRSHILTFPCNARRHPNETLWSSQTGEISTVGFLPRNK